jgi:hypothetical protein
VGGKRWIRSSGMQVKTGWEGSVLMAFFLEIFKDNLENFAVGNCVVVIKVVVCKCFLINLEALIGVEVGAFFLEL